MKKLQLKKEIVQDLDMLKIRGGDDTTTRTITGDSGGTNCGSCRHPCPTRDRLCPTQKDSCAGNNCDTLTDPITENSISGKSQCNNICYITDRC